jgi:hypothetical protein
MHFESIRHLMFLEMYSRVVGTVWATALDSCRIHSVKYFAHVGASHLQGLYEEFT